jgi:hypothetical protein
MLNKMTRRVSALFAILQRSTGVVYDLLAHNCNHSR